MRTLIICFMTPAVILLSVGCHHPAKTIPASAGRPLKAEFDLPGEIIVNGRYLVIKVTPGDKRKTGVFHARGSFSILGSAWGLMAFDPALNLRVIDLQERKTQTVFDRQVALGSWALSFEGGKPDLRIANTLLLTARTDDTTGDNQIDWEDALSIFAYDLPTGELRCLTPDGYDTRKYYFPGKRLILALEEKSKPGKISIYESDPVSGKGSFIVQGLSP